MDRRLVALLGRARGVLEDRIARKRAAYEEIHGEVLACFLALAQVALPGDERIGPGAYGVFVASELFHAEGRAPVVVAEKRHRHALPVGRADAAPKELGD